jgi:hypothetical protein
MDVGPSDVGPSTEAGDHPPNTPGLPDKPALPEPSRPA